MADSLSERIKFEAVAIERFDREAARQLCNSPTLLVLFQRGWSSYES
ncbi:hypothetical protein Q2T42_30035 [Leptolyngbya boryana CZ1]|uniref:Uncharacterized protein n=1 Tax=Leptolyngbya boryana CZ1 TaxID=3060204 RepID=A0AA96WUU8_LEPBY|nr:MULTISPECIES: hypothetical protein [Leptolyngbya]MBD2365951.1 hypothetical protein [Leptolyngbya sp. FACHB-161]MBD2372131.1 hypothetical protein [Leptolyngbya sp. FACHB-238]MBD2396554.1 hypothetical protein [Leptolyngbya sp. FACHB-239]MBD2403077.1 hypothetical protein [Leptolyngbya sp. FACHB-402]ULP31880.1 hypothetical protein MCP04_08985 [Leptolyngbya boryana IU 594]